MSATGLDVFDKTLQTTNIWLDEIVTDLGPSRQDAWHALGAVLRTIRDRLPVELAAHLGAQLPLLVRGAYYDQFRPSEPPTDLRSLDEFLSRVGEGLEGIRPMGADDAARAVFRVLSRHVDGGQVEKIKQAMPEPIRQSWEAASRPVEARASESETRTIETTGRELER